MAALRRRAGVEDERTTGFAGGAQAALDATRPPIPALLNNDAVAETGWLVRSWRSSRRPDGAAVDQPDPAGARRPGEQRRRALNRWGVGYDRGYGQEDGRRTRQPAEVATFRGCGRRLRVGRHPPGRRVRDESFLYYEDTDLVRRLCARPDDIPR